jgi:hypothetical protein
VSRSRPLAVGLVQTSPDVAPAARRQLRIAVALFANDEGYALVETFEIDGRPVHDDAAFEALEELSVRLDADALLVVGLLDRTRVDSLADRARLVVYAACS